MKIHEYNQMMQYLTRPANVLGNNINDRKISNTGARTSLKRGGSDTKPAPKKAKILEYIDDHNIVYGDKKATKADAEAAAKRIDSYKKQMVAKKIPVIPPKPDLVNGHSDWDTDTWLENIDPGGWANEDKKRTGILEFELADEYWQEQYNQYLNNGGTLDFKNFMQQQNNMKVSKKINKIVEEKKESEGLAAILGVKV
jgi:hypothetical protein